jgi:hypothetical protein
MTTEAGPVPADQGQKQKVIEEVQPEVGQAQREALLEERKARWGDRPRFSYSFTSSNRPAGDPKSRTVSVSAPDLEEAERVALEDEGFDVRKESAVPSMEDDCPEMVEYREEKEARMRPLVDSLRSQLAAAGADVSNLGDDVLEALVTVGREALEGMGGGMSGMGFSAPPWRGSGRAPAGFARPGPSFGQQIDSLLGGFVGARNGIPLGAETFSLGANPGPHAAAEQSAFGYLVAMHRERQRKIALFRDVLAGAALWLGNRLAPQPHPFEAFAAPQVVPSLTAPANGPWVELGEPAPIPAPGEGF